MGLLFQQLMRAYDVPATRSHVPQTNLLSGASVDLTGDRFVLGPYYDAR